MAKATGYAVMKFVSGNGRCHKGSDYVKGKLLSDYFRDRPQLRKDQLFRWMRQIGKLLEQYHKCGARHYYRFVNPYMIVLAEDGALMLIDSQAESNQELVQKMHQESIRSKFLPAEEAFYRRGSRELDIYGMGCTMQYMLAQTILTPKLTKYEEYRLRRLIQECLNYNTKKCFANVSQVLKIFPKPQSPTPALRAVLAIMAIMIGIFIVFSDTTESSAKTNLAEPGDDFAAKMIEEPDPVSPLLTELYLELGYVYLARLNLPGEGQRYFTHISSQNEIAKYYELIAGYMCRPAPGNGGRELEAALSDLERLIDTDAEVWDYCVWLRAYALLNTSQARQEMIRIGEKAMMEAIDEPIRQEITEQLAEAYREEGESQQALVCYEQIKLWAEAEKLESVFLQMITIYEEQEDLPAAVSICAQAVNELSSSLELKVRHIKLLCQSAGEDKQAVEQVVLQYLTQQPELRDEAAFQTLQTEYGIQTEGDQVWIRNE